MNLSEIFQKNSWKQHFWQQRNEEILEELKVETVEEKTRRYK